MAKIPVMSLQQGGGQASTDPNGPGTCGPVPPPLPTDPVERQKLFAMLDAGNADIKAGRHIEWVEIKRIWANKRAATTR